MGAINSLSTDLQRQTILGEAVREFALRLAPLKAFSTVFSNVALEGTNEVVVPYYPLTGTTSSTFDPADGYAFDQATTISSKKVTVDKHLYQPLDFSSTELSRQPQLKIQELVNQGVAKLAADVLADVFSAITLANFGAAGLTVAAAAIDSNDLAVLSGKCSAANWPEGRRSLIMGTGYDTQLKQDPSIKLALNIGGTEVIRQGRVPDVAGFSYYHMPNMPTNGEALGGFAVHPNALAFVSAPIAPAPTVRERLGAYSVITDPETGISLAYQCFGEPKMGREYHLVECCYGYAVLNPAALKRITFA